MPSKEDKLEKIIKLLEEIKANQPVIYYPAIVYPPQPYIQSPDPWQDGTHWASEGNLYH